MCCPLNTVFQTKKRGDKLFSPLLPYLWVLDLHPIEVLRAAVHHVAVPRVLLQLDGGVVKLGVDEATSVGQPPEGRLRGEDLLLVDPVGNAVVEVPVGGVGQPARRPQAATSASASARQVVEVVLVDEHQTGAHRRPLRRLQVGVLLRLGRLHGDQLSGRGKSSNVFCCCRFLVFFIGHSTLTLARRC